MYPHRLIFSPRWPHSKSLLKRTASAHKQTAYGIHKIYDLYCMQYTQLRQKFSFYSVLTTQLPLGIKQCAVRHPKTPQESAMRTRSTSSRLKSDSSCPGNPVLKILNLDLTYDASRVSPQSRNRITCRKKTLLGWVSANTSSPLHSEVTYGQGETTVNPVTHHPQVMHSYIFWQTATKINHLHSCYIAFWHCQQL